MTEKTGLVLEGGGFRAIYSAAILEVFHRHNIFFPYVVGTSAGAAYGISYVTRQQGRNLATNRYIDDKRYCGIKHFLKQGNYFNWEFVYKEIPTKLIPLDYEELIKTQTVFEAVLTNCRTAEACYVSMNVNSPELVCDYLTATSSLPFVSKIKQIDGEPYLDGGLADAIPVQEAFRKGNERLLIVLTRPKHYRKKKSGLAFWFKVFYRKYPKMIERMKTRNDEYNRCLDEIEKLEKEGKVFVIRPEKDISVKKSDNNPELLQKVYEETLSEAELIIPKLKEWLAKA